MANLFIKFKFVGFFLLAFTTNVICGDLDANGQGVLRIAAVVNDRVISALDVINRLKFVIWSTQLPNTKENRKNNGF